MDIVSFETAKRLKEAGFPQPELEYGQFWYDDFQEVICFGATVDNWGEPDEDVSVFAQTATDILRELPGIYVCINDAKVWRAEWSGTDCYSDAIAIASGENPAEVAAAAWLSLNAKSLNDSGYKFGEWQPIQFVDMTKSNER